MIGVIGGSGFVGTRLCRRFEADNKAFMVLDLLASPEFGNCGIKGGVCSALDLETMSRSDVLINRAAVNPDDVRPLSLYDDINVGGARSVCDAARKHNITKIVFTSSVAIYGFAAPDTDESGAVDYFNDYGRTKFLAEEVYKEWQREDPENRTLVIVRPTVIFGEANRGNVYNLLKQIASGRFLMFGDGANKKSMAYVENVGAFLEYSLSFKPGLHIYNYIDKPDFDMSTLISKIKETLFGRANVGVRLPVCLGIGIGYVADIAAMIIRNSLSYSGLR